MASQTYTLVVQSPSQERQLRRLGAAVALSWTALPRTVQDMLVTQAGAVQISGENAQTAELQQQILDFLESGAIRTP